MTIGRMSSRNDMLIDTPFKFSLHIFHRDVSHARGRMRLWKVWCISPQSWTELSTLSYIVNLRNCISSNNLLINQNSWHSWSFKFHFVIVFDPSLCMLFIFFTFPIVDFSVVVTSVLHWLPANMQTAHFIYYLFFIIFIILC